MAAALLLLSACAPQSVAPMGERPTIVSLNPCSDAVLAQTTAPGQLLAISHYSHDPRSTSMDLATARRYRTTGGTVEEVLALDPDVVVASSFIAPATRAALTDLGIRVETVGIAGSVADSVAQVRQLAALAGDPAAGEALVRRIERAARPVAGEPVDTALWQAGGIVPGEGALVADLMRRAGLASHSAKRGMGQADYLPLERVLADPPELLLVAGSERGQSHPALAALPQTRVAHFDPALTYCGGPTIPRAMERLKTLRASS